MKIEKGSGVGSAVGPRRAGGAAAPGFALALDAPKQAAPVTGMGGVTPLNAILALQSDEPPARRRARQTRRGRDALDALERLEHGLALGRAPASLRSELESLRRDGELTGEAGLDDILREIDTRLAVELAKLEKTLGRSDAAAQP